MPRTLPTTPSAAVPAYRPARRNTRALLWFLAPLPWLVLGLSESARAVLAHEPVWVRDVAAGQLLALSVFIALAGSAFAWRKRRGPERVMAHVAVGSHALFLVALGCT